MQPVHILDKTLSCGVDIACFQQGEYGLVSCHMNHIIIVETHTFPKNIRIKVEQIKQSQEKEMKAF